MIVVGIDPGKQAPRNVWFDGVIWRTQIEPYKVSPLVSAFVEGQFPNQKASRQSLMTLSFFAGLHAGAYLQQGCKVYGLQPEEWRGAIDPKSARTDKIVFQNRCRREGILPASIDDTDEADAYLIAYAGRELLKRGAKMREIKWTK